MKELGECLKWLRRVRAICREGDATGERALLLLGATRSAARSAAALASAPPPGHLERREGPQAVTRPLEHALLAQLCIGDEGVEQVDVRGPADDALVVLHARLLHVLHPGCCWAALQAPGQHAHRRGVRLARVSGPPARSLLHGAGLRHRWWCEHKPTTQGATPSQRPLRPTFSTRGSTSPCGPRSEREASAGPLAATEHPNRGDVTPLLEKARTSLSEKQLFRHARRDRSTSASIQLQRS